MEAETSAIGIVLVTGAAALAAFLPAVLRLAILPAVVLELLFGVLIGPQGFGLVEIGPVLDALAEMGLAVLFLIAGLEIDPAAVRGAPMRLALRGWAASLALAAILATLGALMLGLPAPAFVAIAVSTTAIGALMPMLQDQGQLRPPYGPFVLASGVAGEALPLVALSLALAGSAGIGLQGVILVLFAATAAGAVLLAGRLQRTTLPPVLRHTMTSASQFPIRLALFLTIGFALLGTSLGLDLVLGAFVSGAVMRALLPHDLHEALMHRLSAVGYGFLVPVFFVTSGMELDVAALAGAPVALLAIPAFAVMMLAVRGLPVLWIYRGTLTAPQRQALALHSGTQLPLVVAISALAVERGAMPGWCGAALVAGAVLTVVVYPALATRVLARS